MKSIFLKTIFFLLVFCLKTSSCITLSLRALDPQPEGIYVDSEINVIYIRENINTPEGGLEIAEILVNPDPTTTPTTTSTTISAPTTEESTETTVTVPLNKSTEKYPTDEGNFADDLQLSITLETTAFQLTQDVNESYHLKLGATFDYETDPTEYQMVIYRLDDPESNLTINVRIGNEWNEYDPQICTFPTMEPNDTRCNNSQVYEATIFSDHIGIVDLGNAFFVRDLDLKEDESRFVVVMSDSSENFNATFELFSMNNESIQTGSMEYKLTVKSNNLLLNVSGFIATFVVIPLTEGKAYNFQVSAIWTTINITVVDPDPTSPSTTSSEEPPTETTTELTSTTTSTTTPSTTLSTTNSTTLPPSTSTTTLPTTPFPGSCLTNCTGTDASGRPWTVCAGEVGRENCGKLRPNSTGIATWECSFEGQFITEQPDLSKCASGWVEDFKNKSDGVIDSNTAVNFLMELESVIQKSEDPEKPRPNYFGHEIQAVNELLSKVVEIARNATTNPTNFENVAKQAVRVSNVLITSREAWIELRQDSERSRQATNLLNTIQTTALILSSKIDVSTRRQASPFYESTLAETGEVAIVATAANRENAGLGSQFPREGSISTETTLLMPPGWVDLVPGEAVHSFGMTLSSDFASLMLPGQYKLGLDSSLERKKIMNGKLMSFTVASDVNVFFQSNGSHPVDFLFPDRGVRISFKHDLEAWGDEAFDLPRRQHNGENPKAARGTAQCVYWDTENGNWSTAGCRVVSSTEQETICECSHLTSFAILMDVHNFAGKDLGLEILTLILCPISIICLLLTIFFFATIRMAKSQRTLITVHLCSCLCLGNILVLLVLDKNYFNLSKGVCIASGILIHYLFLAAFGWMAIQGYHLYNMVLNVMGSMGQDGSRFFIFRILAFVGPVFPIAVVAMAGYMSGDDPYGGEVVCWLNGSYIWGFMGPILIICVGNILILGKSLWKSHKVRNSSKASNSSRRISSLRTWIRGTFVLTVLLGLTWLVGYLMLVPSIPGKIAAYFFTVLNASQGIFIFCFDCLSNEKLRNGVHRQYGNYLPSFLNSWLKKTSDTTTPATSSTNVSRGRDNARNVADFSTTDNNGNRNVFDFSTTDNNGNSDPPKSEDIDSIPRASFSSLEPPIDVPSPPQMQYRRKQRDSEASLASSNGNANENIILRQSTLPFPDSRC